MRGWGWKRDFARFFILLLTRNVFFRIKLFFYWGDLCVHNGQILLLKSGNDGIQITSIGRLFARY